MNEIIDWFGKTHYEILTRQNARVLGENKYYTGRPCRNGHYAPRYVQSGVCQHCLRESRRGAVPD